MYIFSVSVRELHTYFLSVFSHLYIVLIGYIYILRENLHIIYIPSYYFCLIEGSAFADGIEFLTPSLPDYHEFETGSEEETFSRQLVHLWATFATHQ